MKLHRFIGDFTTENEKEIKITDPKIIKQIMAVLRLEISEHIILSDGKGKEYEVAIEEMKMKEIIGKIIKKTFGVESDKKVNLYLAILKKENFELAAQKAVEAGVWSITPVITKRTIKTGLNEARIKK